MSPLFSGVFYLSIKSFNLYAAVKSGSIVDEKAGEYVKSRCRNSLTVKFALRADVIV